MADIAVAANVSGAGSLYYFFDSREELVRTVLEEALTQIYDLVRIAVESRSDLPITERILAAAEAHFESAVEHAGATLITDQVPRSIRREHLRRMVPYFKYWESLLEEAMAEGLLPADADVKVLRTLILSTLSSTAVWASDLRIDRRQLSQASLALLGLANGLVAIPQSRTAAATEPPPNT